MAKEMVDMHREALGEDLARMAVDSCGVTWNEVCERTRNGPAGKGGLRKSARLVRARDLAVWRLRQSRHAFSYPDISRIVGYRDHTAAMIAFKRTLNKLLTVEEPGKMGAEQVEQAEPEPQTVGHFRVTTRRQGEVVAIDDVVILA